MKAAIYGVGRMGTAISWAMRSFGFDIVCIDANPSASDRLKALFGDENFTFYRTTNPERDCEEILTIEKPDIVISSLPYHQTEVVAKKCVDFDIRYCDLGGRVDVSENINDYSRENGNVPIMTDLGLAPGWVNILAEQGCRQVYGQIEDVIMMVGGLPVRRIQPHENPLAYELTWSTDGLLNEYRDDCSVLRRGNIITVPGMSELEDVTTKYGEFEAFNTSGGASHSIKSMQLRGVNNCQYKTMRYPGHCNFVRFLMDRCGMSDEDLMNVFEIGCGYADRDVVYLVADVRRGDVKWRKELKVTGDFRFSAMQRCTAFPISCVARMMAEGMFDEVYEEYRGYKERKPLQLSYRDIPFDKFKTYLKELKIDT